MHRGRLLPVVSMLVLATCGTEPAIEPLRVAVAANFKAPFEVIAARFTARSGLPVDVVTGSTGKLFAQIVNGAPFDVLLAADQERPARLVAEALAVPDSRFTYATGRLAICAAPQLDVPTDGWGPHLLATPAIGHVAIANPKTAPYGLAAVQTLDALGIRAKVEPKLVVGESIGQAMQFVAVGGAEVGLVALSQVVDRPHWTVPSVHHAPIRQDAVLLARAADDARARDLLAFLRSEEVREILLEFGYEPSSD